MWCCRLILLIGVTGPAVGRVATWEIVEFAEVRFLMGFCYSIGNNCKKIRNAGDEKNEDNND